MNDAEVYPCHRGSQACQHTPREVVLRPDTDHRCEFCRDQMKVGASLHVFGDRMTQHVADLYGRGR